MRSEIDALRIRAGLRMGKMRSNRHMEYALETRVDMRFDTRNQFGPKRAGDVSREFLRIPDG